MTNSNILNMNDEQIRQLIFSQLTEHGDVRRKQLIEYCISMLDFSVDQLMDTATSSPVIRAKSRIGTILSGALHTGYILEDDLGFLHLNSEELHYISRERGKDFVVSTLEEFGQLSKGQIFQKAEKTFGTDLTPDRNDDNALRSTLGKVIYRLEEEKHIICIGDKYKLAHDKKYPNTELGSYLREASLGGDIQKCFLKSVHAKGGEWFEVFAVNLLEKYFRLSGKEIITASVTGGSNDGGIDGEINTIDWLGYREHILMQMKNRNAIISSKDVREFYGAVCAEKGSRGLYITISQFHIEAQKLLDKVDNLIGIDGQRLFEIACKCQYAIKETNRIYTLDEQLFLNT